MDRWFTRQETEIEYKYMERYRLKLHQKPFFIHQADNIQMYDNTSHWESCEEKKKSHTLLVRRYIVKTSMENNLAESLKTTNAYSL